MDSAEYLKAYDIGARSRTFVAMPSRASRAEVELLKLGQGIENRGRLFGEIVQIVLEKSVAVSGLSSSEERKQAVRQDDEFTDYLYGDVLDRLDEYETWIETGLVKDNRRIGEYAESDSAELSKMAKDIQKHMFFHVINDDSMLQWFDFIEEGVLGHEPKKQTLIKNVGELAITGIGAINHRTQEIRRNGHSRDSYLTSPESFAWRGDLEGMLNEVDTGIALLEASAANTQERFWILPSPPQFEYLAGVNNADFLVISAKSNRAVGVQAKSGVDMAAEANPQVNPRVVLINGRYDLGNSVALPDQSNGDERPRYSTHSYAGSLSLAAASKYYKQIPQMKQIRNNPRYYNAVLAAIHSKDRQPALKRATDRVSYKLAQAL